jgi:type IV secretion system protein VirB3
MEIEKLNHYPLFVALTRPPMVFGVTLTFFCINFVCSICFALMTKNIVITGGLGLLLHMVGLMGCKKDNHFFEVVLGKLKLACPNRKTWGCNSYDPF